MARHGPHGHHSGGKIPVASPNQMTGEQPSGSAIPHGRDPKLTPVEVGRVLLDSGWPKNPRLVAKGIAIVEAESSGDWTKDSDSPNPSGGINRGGWQIDSKSHPDVSDGCARDPSCSSKWVWRTTHGTNYSQWATAGADPVPWSGAAREAIAKGPLRWSSDTGGILGGGINVPNPIVQVAQVLEKIAQFFVGLGELLLTPEGWLRLGKLIAGATLVALGVNRLAKLSLGVDPIGAATRGTFATLSLGRGTIGRIGGLGMIGQGAPTSG